MLSLSTSFSKSTEIASIIYNFIHTLTCSSKRYLHIATCWIDSKP